MCGWLSAAIALRFALESLADVGSEDAALRQDLDRDGPVEARVARLVDLAHPARADEGADLVRAEQGTRSNRHREWRL